MRFEHRPAYGEPTGQAGASARSESVMDPALDRWADQTARLGDDVVREILVEDVLGGHPALKSW